MRKTIGRGQAWGKIILHRVAVYTAAPKLNLPATFTNSYHVVILQKRALERLKLKFQYVITLSKF